MHITYDPRADALYIQFQQGKFARNKEVEEGIIFDIGIGGEILGIEILEAASRIGLSEIPKVVVEMPLQLPVKARAMETA